MLTVYVLPATLMVPCVRELTTVFAATEFPLSVIPSTSVPEPDDENVNVGAPVIVVDAIVFAWLIVNVVPVAPVTMYVPAATPVPEIACPVTKVIDAVIVSVVLDPDVDPVPLTVAAIVPVNRTRADRTDDPIPILESPVLDVDPADVPINIVSVPAPVVAPFPIAMPLATPVVASWPMLIVFAKLEVAEVPITIALVALLNTVEDVPIEIELVAAASVLVPIAMADVCWLEAVFPIATPEVVWAWEPGPMLVDVPPDVIPTPATTSQLATPVPPTVSTHMNSAHPPYPASVVSVLPPLDLTVTTLPACWTRLIIRK
jgi:hypothetical protein